MTNQLYEVGEGFCRFKKIAKIAVSDDDDDDDDG